MGWAVAIAVLIVISLMMESGAGKALLVVGAVAIGLLLLSWITSAGFFVVLAKACAVIAVVIIVGVIVLTICG